MGERSRRTDKAQPKRTGSCGYIRQSVEPAGKAGHASAAEQNRRRFSCHGRNGFASMPPRKAAGQRHRGAEFDQPGAHMESTPQYSSGKWALTPARHCKNQRAFPQAKRDCSQSGYNSRENGLVFIKVPVLNSGQVENMVRCRDVAGCSIRLNAMKRNFCFVRNNTSGLWPSPGRASRRTRMEKLRC